jgi:hypothetical protein
LAAFGQKPAFCEQVEESALRNLQAPYSKYTTPEGTPYCEGLLVDAFAAVAPSIISIKQVQPPLAPVTAGKLVTVTWCDDAKQKPVHVSLRSTVAPLFGLDGLQQGSFRWKSDMMATWQPQWSKVAAEAKRDVTVNSQTFGVVVPLRMGAGYSNTYSFMIRSEAPVNLTRALITSISPPGGSKSLAITLSKGPSRDTWLASIAFGAYPAGIYQVTFTDQADGNISVPVYLFHGACKVNE